VSPLGMRPLERCRGRNGPPGGCSVQVSCMTAIDMETANAAANGIETCANSLWHETAHRTHRTHRTRQHTHNTQPRECTARRTSDERGEGVSAHQIERLRERRGGRSVQ
jgi:hypothetical protein